MVDSSIPCIRGLGQFRVKVASTDKHRESFDKLCGARRMQSVFIKTRAQLLIQNEAVFITINGLQVGILSPQDARAFDRIVRYGPLSGHEAFECSARVLGGWSTSAGSEEHYRVHLDLNFHD